MALKVKAVEKKIKFSKEDPGVYRYVMQPDLYIALSQAKVIREAALRSGVSQGVMKACWDAAGEVIKVWATEGHSVALPGLGTMRFGLRAKSVVKVVTTFYLITIFFLFFIYMPERSVDSFTLRPLRSYMASSEISGV